MRMAHPGTFGVPTMEELAAIKPGDSVKVCAEGERFWATVNQHTSGLIIATVDNDLTNTEAHGLRLGDTITVERRHIYQILK
jgi:hypothetical protein